MMLYHFTTALHVPSILAEGVLRTTDPNLFPDGPVTYRNEETGRLVTLGGPIQGTPVVWLLDTSTVEYDHGIGDGTGPGYDKRAVRFTVEVRGAMPWLRWITARKFDAAHVARIVRAGGGRAAARHWYVVPRPIPRGEWIEVTDMAAGRAIE